MTRRTACRLAAVGLAGVGVGAGAAGVLARMGAERRAYQFFSDAEAVLVIDLAEQIVPRDDVPGATDAGVVHYLDRQLSTRLSRHQPAYRAGLAAVEGTSRQLHRRSFGELTAAEKTALLERIEAGRVPAELWRGVGPAGFFRLLVDHVMQGFYGSPRHGGNRDYVSYRILGLDYPQVIGRNRPHRT